MMARHTRLAQEGSPPGGWRPHPSRSSWRVSEIRKACSMAHMQHTTCKHTACARHTHTFQHTNTQPVPQGTHTTCTRTHTHTVCLQPVPHSLPTDIHTSRLPPNPQTQSVPYSLPHQHTHIQPVPQHTVCSYTRLLPSCGAPWSYGTLPQHLTPSAVPGQHLPTVTPTVGSKGRGLDGQVLPSSVQPGSPRRGRKRKGLLLIILQFRLQIIYKSKNKRVIKVFIRSFNKNLNRESLFVFVPSTL